MHEVYSRISLQERIALVRLRLVGKPRIGFRDLLEESTPSEVVGTLLAILELVRLGEIRVVQTGLFGKSAFNPTFGKWRSTHDAGRGKSHRGRADLCRERPLSAQEIAEIIELDPATVEALVEEIRKDYGPRALTIRMVAGATSW